MALFQKSVLKKYLSAQSEDTLKIAFSDFQRIFNNPIKQQNIQNSKEEQYQEGFLRELFVQVLGYTLNPDENFNLITEQKNERDSKKADGAILKGAKIHAIIELKSAKTIDLATIEIQAFGYKNNQQACEYVITSNFKKLRFYINNAVDFQEFDLFNLTFEDFKILWVCLNRENLLKDVPAQIKEASNNAEESVTAKLYTDYAVFRKELFQGTRLKNESLNKVIVFKKTQKLLDRFLFLFFAEDRGLVSPNWTRKILQDWADLKDRFDNYIPLYDRFKKNFNYLNSGYIGKDGEVFAYNGGLFAPDDILDAFIIDDDILYEGSWKLSNYDFESEIDVNILGHIFEHSLNEIDELEATLDSENGAEASRQTKRKKDGVFYTPKYVTKYIVDNTIGTICSRRKQELGISEDQFEFINPKAKGALKSKRLSLNQKINDYRLWLLDLKIVDPACGSGAFLNQALEYLIAEHRKIDEFRAQLLGGSIILSDVENSILEHNLYGVDINAEAIEIAKLSLWLRTARKGRKLSSLNNNLKVGNSLIDENSIVGDSAFSWKSNFPEVFDKGGFSVVIGNPPYVPMTSISDIEKQFYYSKFKTSEYQINTYSLFIEKSIDILANGYLYGLIVPNYFVSTKYDKRLRQLMCITNSLTEIINTYNVFSDAVVDTVIIIGKASPGENTIIKSIDSHLTTVNERLKALAEGRWKYSEIVNFSLEDSGDPTINFHKTDAYVSEFTLSDFLEFKKGMQPYEEGKGTPPQTREMMTNKVYHSNHKLDESYLPLLTSSTVKRYSINWNGEWIKYGINLAAPRQKRLFSGERILLNRILSKNKFDVVFTDQDFINNSDIFNLVAKPNGIKVSVKALSALIGSSYCSNYFLHRNINLNRQAFPKVNVSTLESFPVANEFFQHQDELAKLADSLVNINVELKNCISRFLSFVIGKFHLLSPSRKLENWYSLDSKAFLAEFVRHDLKLSLSQQEEWLQYFSEKKSEFLLLKTTLEDADNKIDEMVASIYSS